MPPPQARVAPRPADVRPFASRRAAERESDGGREPPEEVADRLHSAAIHLLRRLRREDRQIGLSAPRLSALSVVVMAGPITLGDLAGAEQVRPPTMTRLVSALEAKGLVTREPDPHDRRLTRVRATSKGQTLFAKGRARRIQALATQVRRLDARDVATLRRAAELMEQLSAR
jgi:DNA-binding MarR family transcriptional regulator